VRVRRAFLLPRLLAAFVEGKGEVEDHAAHRNAEGELVSTIVAREPHDASDVLLRLEGHRFQGDAFDIHGLGTPEGSGPRGGQGHMWIHVVARGIRTMG